MKALVTGGSGFIGSHVVDKLRDAGHEPCIYDRQASPWHEPGEIETFIGDLDDSRALEAAMQGCDAVMHLAAAADVNEVEKDPVGSEEINSRGTLNVLEAARRAGVERVVYASTIWVYTGESGQVVDEESDLGMPNHLYTATKLAGEMYCKSYSELYDLEFTVLRFGIPYGPRARPAAVVPAFVNKALAGDPLTVAGGGEQSRRFVYVEDLARGCVKGLEPQAADRVFNLVGDESVTIMEIARLVQGIVGDVEIVHTEGRKADYVGVEVSGARADSELGWRADTPFSEGVRRYVSWRRDQDAAPAVVPAPVAEQAPARERRLPGLAMPAFRMPALTGLARLVVPAFYTVAATGVLVAYLLAVHSVGLVTREASTAATTILVVVGLFLVVELEWDGERRSQMARRVWLGFAALYTVAVILPWGRHFLHLGKPGPVVLMLSLAGAGMGIALAVIGLRLFRSALAEAPEKA